MMHMANPVLEVTGLCKSFGTTKALGDVSLHLKEGEIFGLLGPNGAGKTTFLSIISGLLQPDAGGFLVLGQPLHRARKHLLGIVPQDLAIYNELSARENLRFFGQLYGLGGRDLEGHIDEVLQAVGLLDRAADRAGTFSGGMKRRLNLAAGLVHKPRLLLLDEPTVGVDPQSRNHIFEEVRRLNGQGLTILYTSHYMEEVQALCPRVGILDQGTLIACDSLTNLLNQTRRTEPGTCLPAFDREEQACALNDSPASSLIYRFSGSGGPSHRVNRETAAKTIIRCRVKPHGHLDPGTGKTCDCSSATRACW